MSALKRWWRRYFGREFLRTEARELRRQLTMQGVALIATEELLNEKQRKINRLVTAIGAMRRAHPMDALPGIIERRDLYEERLHVSAQSLMQRYAADFENRQKVYEETGIYDRDEGTTVIRPGTGGGDTD
jgi:hypothetical protein